MPRQHKTTQPADDAYWKPPPALSPNKLAFLGAYVQSCSISRAAELAGLNRRVHYQWLALDPIYRDAFFAAGLEVTERLEDEVVRRGFEGVQRPVTIAGERELVTEFDTTCLLAVLKARHPERWKDRRQVDVDLEGDPSKMSPQVLDALLTKLEQRIAAAEQKALPPGVTVDVEPDTTADNNASNQTHSNGSSD